jgi:hypothetical protein
VRQAMWSLIITADASRLRPNSNIRITDLVTFHDLVAGSIGRQPPADLNGSPSALILHASRVVTENSDLPLWLMGTFQRMGCPRRPGRVTPASATQIAYCKWHANASNSAGTIVSMLFLQWSPVPKSSPAGTMAD